MRSEPYQEFLAEREELLRHKWLMSERLGRDVGFERALLDWARHYRTAWRQQRNASCKDETVPSKGSGK